MEKITQLHSKILGRHLKVNPRIDELYGNANYHQKHSDFALNFFESSYPAFCSTGMTLSKRLNHRKCASSDLSVKIQPAPEDTSDFAPS